MTDVINPAVRVLLADHEPTHDGGRIYCRCCSGVTDDCDYQTHLMWLLAG
jgi:hypothetical protein